MEAVQNQGDDTFETTLKNYIVQLEEVIQKLQDLRQAISSHHQKCNIAKTAGTAVSGAGVAMIVGSVLSAPFIGGGIVTVGAGGAVMSLTGGLSNVITDYIDYKTSSMIMSDIQAIVKTKETFDENLMLQLKHFGMVIERLIESGLDKEHAVFIAVKGIANGCINLTEEPNMNMMTTLSTVVKLHHIESAALETLPIIGRTMHISEKSLQFIYNFFGLSASTGAAVFKTIGRLSSAISVAFTIVDLALLIKDWTTEHPTVEIVLEVERKVLEEKEILSDFLEVIQSSKDEIEDVLQKVVKDIEDIEERELAFEHDFVIVEKESVTA